MDTLQKLIVITPLILSLTVTSAHAKKFYIDPEHGDITNDGSIDSPWSTLQEVLDSNKIETRMYETKPATPNTPLIPKNQGAPVKPGDTLALRDGYHGEIYSSEYYNEEYVTIMAQEGHTPKIASLELRSGCKWIVYRLTISPSFAATYNKKTLIQFASHSWTGPSWDCIAEACTAYSVLDASNWTLEQWDTLSCNGMSIPGNRILARNNYFKNVNFGISVTGDSCLVEYNTVENFAGDGLRGLGDYGTYQYNVIKNCYDVNANHDDGFQSWSVGDSGVGTGVVYGVVIRGNTIINYEDSNQPFLGTLQGIGCFDGMFEDWLVVNNVVITDHWHGITLSGATNCVIINNTVVDLNTNDPGPPWVRIGDHKDGTPSTGCFVRNNLATGFNSTGQDVTEDHNIEIENYDDFFVNYTARDLHLKEGCAAIDLGSTDLAPTIDRDRKPRPQGNGIDIGAYEYGTVDIINNISQNNNKDMSIKYVYNAHSVIIYFKNPQIKDVHIYDIQGRLINSLSRLNKTKVIWHTNELRNGVYIIRLVSGERFYSERIFLIR